jgi:hypothetical protein
VKSNDEIDSFYEIFIILIKILSLHVRKISSSNLIIIFLSRYFHQSFQISSFENFTFDFSSDTNLFDLKARESSSISLKKSISSSLFHHVRRRYQNDLFIRNNAIERFFRVSNMTERNKKLINFYESLTLRRNWECRVTRVNQFSFKRNRVDLNRLNHFRKISQNQNKQSQNCDDHEKSIKMQRQESSEERNQREKRVKNSEELVQFVRIENVKWFLNQTLNHHSRQQSKCHELRSTI